MEETKQIKKKYELDEIAKKLDIKGNIVNARMSMNGDEMDGVVITIEEENEEE